jgi:hypothetical protein
MIFNKVLSIFISVLTVIGFAQNNVFTELQSHPAYEVILLDDSTVKVYKKFENYTYLKTLIEKPGNEKRTGANLIIELDTVNYTDYGGYYKRWGSIPAVNLWTSKYLSFDANKNNKNELYVWFYTYQNDIGSYNTTRVYEHDRDSLFFLLYEFSEDTLRSFFDLGDITGDGLLDIFCVGTQNNLRFFKQNSPNDLIIFNNINYNPFPSEYQINHGTLYDIDNDGNLELIYFLFAGDSDSSWAYCNHVAKFNPVINNYELIYFHRPLPDRYTNGFSIGDFDMDGRRNFATGSLYGKFYIYEHVNGSEYRVEFSEQLDTKNAYLTVFTDDMDGNGKPEIWIGGDFSSSIYGGVTRLFAYEAISEGLYEQVYQIDIRGLFSAIDGKLSYVDLDGDGIKELFLTNANLAFGFKYDGYGNYFMDFVIKAPRLDSIYVTQTLRQIDVADIDGDGIVEIIPQYILSKGWSSSIEYRSVFLKRDKVSSIVEENTHQTTGYYLSQNYPNPFNPTTKIKFGILRATNVRIIIYDILGKEIIELINENHFGGQYEITWNGTDYCGNLVPSGIYFIRIITDNYQKTIKAILNK